MFLLFNKKTQGGHNYRGLFLTLFYFLIIICFLDLGLFCYKNCGNRTKRKDINFKLKKYAHYNN